MVLVFLMAIVAMAGWLCGAACILAWHLWKEKHEKRDPDRFEPCEIRMVWVCEGKFSECYHKERDCQSVPRKSGKMRRYRQCLRCFPSGG